jgi:hypothetical protein
VSRETPLRPAKLHARNRSIRARETFDCDCLRPPPPQPLHLKVQLSNRPRERRELKRQLLHPTLRLLNISHRVAVKFFAGGAVTRSYKQAEPKAKR